MDRFLNQATHNEEFHSCLCENFTEKFYDWRITSLFYTAIHYLKALALKRVIDIVPKEKLPKGYKSNGELIDDIFGDENI